MTTEEKVEEYLKKAHEMAAKYNLNDLNNHWILTVEIAKMIQREEEKHE